MPSSAESGDDDSDNSVPPYPIMLDADKDDIGAIVDSCRDDSTLNCTDALSLCIGSLCALVLLRSGERPKILEIALNVQEQMLRIRKNAILILDLEQQLLEMKMLESRANNILN